MSAPATRSEAGFRAPVGVDTDRASVARVYDYSLGGKDYYDVDRAAYAAILEVAPRQGDVSIMNRRWLHRVTRHLAGTAATPPGRGPLRREGMRARPRADPRRSGPAAR